MGIFIGLLLVGSTFASAQSAPSDVPKNHWAYQAVDELFRNGLLDAYPTNMDLVIDHSAIFDQKVLNDDINRWRQNGLLVGYPEGLGRGFYPDNRSSYEFAVATYNACAVVRENALHSRGSGQAMSQFRMNVVPEIPNIVKAISMLIPELERLGAKPHDMVVGLNRYWPKSMVTFRG